MKNNPLHLTWLGRKRLDQERKKERRATKNEKVKINKNKYPQAVCHRTAKRRRR
jgi:hypothetical protein